MVPYCPQDSPEPKGKNLPYVYREVMERLNDDDWAIFMDYDCMFLTPHWYPVLESIIAKNPDAVGIWVTHLSRGPHGTPQKVGAPDTLDIKRQAAFTRRQLLAHGTSVLDITEEIKRDAYRTTGPIQVVSKRGWLAAGLDKEETWDAIQRYWTVDFSFKGHKISHCDTFIGKELCSVGRLLLAEGLYVFHHQLHHFHEGDAGDHYRTDYTAEGGMIDLLYQQACNKESDINEHLPYLRLLAKDAGAVVELGVRTGISTTALLAGAQSVTSYDIDPQPLEELSRLAGDKWSYNEGDSTQIDIPECGMLFIDTLHEGDQLRRELSLHSHKASKYIAMHDTVSYGEKGERGGEGLITAIEEFINDHSEWGVKEHFTNNNGLMVLERTQS